MDAIKEHALQDFLLAHGNSLEALPKSRRDQLSKVYDAVERRKIAMHDAKKSFSENSITIIAVAAETGIARKTFYNNELLKQYIEEQASKLDDTKTLAKERAEYKEQVEQLKEENWLLTLRDLDTLKLEHQISELSKEIAEKDTRIVNLEKEYEKVCAELSEAQLKLKSKNKIHIVGP